MKQGGGRRVVDHGTLAVKVLTLGGRLIEVTDKEPRVHRLGDQVQDRNLITALT